MFERLESKIKIFYKIKLRDYNGFNIEMYFFMIDVNSVLYEVFRYVVSLRFFGV